ncbi:MAG: capsid cement protein [Candidatus Limnocylindrus sp.]
MATQYLGNGTFLANTTITAFQGVVISSNRGVGLSTSTALDGFAQIDAASGDYVTVRFAHSDGTIKAVITGTPVTVGDTLYLAASGLVSTTGTVTVGKSLSTQASGNGSAVIEFIPKNL